MANHAAPNLKRFDACSALGISVEASEDGGHEMWGEGASDLWGRLEREEDEREAELLEAIRFRLRGSICPGDDDPKQQPPAGLKAAA